MTNLIRAMFARACRDCFEGPGNSVLQIQYFPTTLAFRSVSHDARRHLF